MSIVTIIRASQMSSRVIAKHLNVRQSAIIKVEKWANCLFVVVRGLGARFVSKKIMNKIEVDLYKASKIIQNYPKLSKIVY